MSEERSTIAEERSSEEQNETDFVVNGISNLINVIGVINGKCRNLKYDPLTNTTKYYGHSNFEEVKINGKDVALKEDIPDVSNKANVEHKHKTDDISRDYVSVVVNEEEEEEEVIETIGLNEILDGKANIEHKHSLSDITDYIEPDLDTKANVEHKHTLSDITDYVEPDLTPYALKADLDTLTASAAELRSSKANVEHKHTLTDITDYIEPDLSPYAKLNAANTFTGNQTVNVTNDSNNNVATLTVSKSNATTGTTVLAAYLPKLENGSAIFRLGKSIAKGCANICYAVTDSGDYFSIGFAGTNNIFRIYPRKDAELDRGLKISGNITSPTITSLTNNLDSKANVEHKHTLSDITNYIEPDLSPYALKTDLDTLTASAAELRSSKANVEHKHTLSDITDYVEPDLSALIDARIDAKKDELFKEMYPVGSIYVSTVPIAPINNRKDNVSYIIDNFHGCNFMLLPSSTFLKNIDYTRTKPNSYLYVQNDNPKDTGGEAEHTLTVDEMPSHKHTFEGGYSWIWGDTNATESLKDCSMVGGYAGGNTITTRRWGTVKNTGSSKAHNNLPPYYTVYMYK